LEDGIVTVPPTAENPLETKPHEQQIGEAVDDFRKVDACIIVLFSRDRERIPVSASGVHQWNKIETLAAARMPLNQHLPLHTSSELRSLGSNIPPWRGDTE
jgi:hypothetical protein